MKYIIGLILAIALATAMEVATETVAATASDVFPRKQIAYFYLFK